MRLIARWGLWSLIAVALITSLAVGSQRKSAESLDQRVHSLSTQVRCPVCGGESAAESQVPAAVAIRQQIRTELASGVSSKRVLADLVRVYGVGILEKPEARGIGLLVWVLPVVAFVAGLVALGVAFARWRPRRLSGRDGCLVASGGASGDDEALVAAALRAREAPDARPAEGGEA